MTKEELIASYPGNNSLTIYLLILLIACFVFIMWLTAALNQQRTLAMILFVVFVIAIIVSLTGIIINSAGKDSIDSWKNTTYREYIDNVTPTKDKIFDYTLNPDGTGDVFIETKDGTVKLIYSGIPAKVSSTGFSYVSYVKISGLESINIEDSKERITLYMVPKNK
ncbi:hypothetical protein ABGV42_01355 [Paenibacillus pabuli]|uniref:hypothetical protein n=1 Tax=Paenibacillus pabuli TaxID=1472 RepID=UPI003242CC48